MRVATVCSGIGGAEVAMPHWDVEFVSEIEPFASAVLEHHGIGPNLGDINNVRGHGRAADVLVGGTPCQSFSVAGFRKGLADPRGGILLQYLRLAEEMRPRWLVWENVPGVLSADGGRAFGSLLGALEGLGYGWAYRTLDAQYFGLAQRRKRVFVVGCLGDWARAASVLFEPEGLRRDHPPCDQARSRIAAGPRRGTTGGGEVAYSLSAHHGRQDREETRVVQMQDTADPITAHEQKTYTHEGTKNFRTRNVVFTKAQRAHHKDDFESWKDGEVSPTLNGFEGGPSRAPALVTPGVRRLTPTECERLQGFPDGWTDVPYKGKPAKDSPRYKALGNAFPVNVVRWICERLEAADASDPA